MLWSHTSTILDRHDKFNILNNLSAHIAHPAAPRKLQLHFALHENDNKMSPLSFSLRRKLLGRLALRHTFPTTSTYDTINRKTRKTFLLPTHFTYDIVS